MQQTITMAIEAAKTSLRECTELPQSLLLKVNNLTTKYPSFDDFCKEYSPYNQVEFSDERNSIMGNYSPLAILDIAYGVGRSASWINIALGELNAFSGSKNIDDEQTKSLARIIAQEYRDMKISMIQLFFYRFKCGYFGKFYGKVDPMVITCALKEFTEWCSQKQQEYLTEEYNQRHAEEQQRREDLLRRWNVFLSELDRRCADTSGKQSFASMELYGYDEQQDMLTLKVTRQAYEQIEGPLFQLFSEVFSHHFPTAKLQYRIEDAQPSPQEDGNKPPSAAEKEDDVDAVCRSARLIIQNQYGVDQDTLEGMRYGFKRRYGQSPEDYLKKHSTKGKR